MHEQSLTVLTTEDFSTIEGMLHREGGPTGPYALPLLHKLRSATVMLPSDIYDDAVTINSRVRFRIDDGRPEERTIVALTQQEMVGLTLLAWTSRALAMIGMRAGQQAVVRKLDGTAETITVEEVLYQPEWQFRSDASPSEPVIEQMEVDEGGEIIPFNARPLRRGRDFDPPPGDNDPGPSAA